MKYNIQSVKNNQMSAAGYAHINKSVISAVKHKSTLSSYHTAYDE